MNSTTQLFYSRLKNEEFAAFLHYGVVNQPEEWSEVKKKVPYTKDRINRYYIHTARCMIKFLIRNNRRLNKSGITLNNLSEKDNDKYLGIEVKIFADRFSYSKKLGGFVPWIRTKRVHSVLSEYYENLFKEVVVERWNSIKYSLFNPDGGHACLIHDFSKPHVYFIRDKNTASIKIGVSIHPEKRKKELGEGKKKQILKIIPAGGFELENKLHKMFAKSRLHGEWFKPTKELLNYIEQIP